MKPIKAGVDAGNNSLKLITEGGEPIIIPTVYSYYLGAVTELMDEEDIPTDKLEENLFVTINSKALPKNQLNLVVGQKVLNDQYQPTELEKKSNKSTDKLPVISTLSGLAVDAMRRYPEQDKIEITYDLALALPISSITKKTAQENAERFLGSHEIIFHHPSERNVTVVLTVEFAKTLPEGAAAAWGIVFNENGELISRKVESEDGELKEITFENETMLHFDIGAGTTEMVVSNGVKFNPHLSYGLNYGVKETILNVITIWNRKNPRRTIDSLAEFNEIYLNTEHPRHNEIRQIAETGMLQLANRIGQDIINKIDDMKDVPRVFIYGGGAAILKEHLTELLQEKDRLKNVVFVNEPILVNAHGLLIYALSPRFEQMKSKAQTASQKE